MTVTVELRLALTEPLAENFRERLAALPFKTNYQEEQRGENLVASITCTPSQEKMVHDIVTDLGLTLITGD